MIRPNPSTTTKEGEMSKSRPFAAAAVSGLALLSVLLATPRAEAQVDLDVLYYGDADPIAAQAFLLSVQGTTYNDVRLTSVTASSEASFITQLNSGDYNLVIVDTVFAVPDGDWQGALANFVAGGACAIANLGGSGIGNTIAPTFQATIGTDHSELDINSWITNPLFSSYEVVPSPLDVQNLDDDQSGVRLDALAGATVHAGVTVAPAPAEGAIVLGNGGRTILNGFDPRDFVGADADADDDDIDELARNEIFAVGGTGCGSVPAVTEVPTVGHWGLGLLGLGLATTAVASLRRRRA
jgi:hypothetical protein